VAYRIFETQQFQKDLRALDSSLRDRLGEKLRVYVYPSIAQTPRYGPNVKRLRTYEPPTWRYRVGDWRFFYTIDDTKKIVFMLAAEPRDRAYR